MKRTFWGFSIGIAVFCVMLIVVLASGLWKRFLYPKEEEQIRTKIVTPREAGSSASSGGHEQVTWEGNLFTKVPMNEDEIAIFVLDLNNENEEGVSEDQIVVFRYASDPQRNVYITFIAYDNEGRRYTRLWDASTASTRPETVSLFTQDIIGDRNNCIVVTGMNGLNEHTMTIIRRNKNTARAPAYKKIAELQIDGSIIIQETGRSLAYQQGIASGQSYTIAAYGHDSSSSNILDQLETIYFFNPATEQYEQRNVSRIPGSQIEQRRLREILSGRPGVFENFINDLWYYVSPQGTIDVRQYLFFDPTGKTIIFFGDETQQVFHWQNSSPTRYGLFITSQNISISTLRRRIDIELESLDSIKLRVSDDVRLKITVNESWDGSYRRAGKATVNEPKPLIKPAVNANYDSSWGRVNFYDSGEYTISSGSSTRKGRYVFFKVDEHDLLELRAEPAVSSENRMTYKVETLAIGLILSRVRLGTAGVQDMLEPPITLTPVVN